MGTTEIHPGGSGFFSSDDPTEAAKVADLAVRASRPKQIDPTLTYAAIVADGHRVEVLDLDGQMPAPFRTSGIYRPATVDALIAHVERHRDPDHTTIWVHPTSGQVIAVFNDASAEGETGWRDHRSQLDLHRTPEWMFWIAKDGKLMSQLEFAEHMEDGVKEIVEPAAADMLELAQSFHATQSGSFRSAHRLQDGTVQVQYDETIDAVAGRSQEIPIPQTFTLAVSPFLGEDPYRVTARLRYRLNGGKLTLGYRLERPDEVIRDALDKVADRLTAEFNHVFVGEPAA